MQTPHPSLPPHVDVVVIGAGLSGVGAGYHLQTQCPDHSYLILEKRERLGGTWDLFRYPGIRSDSDMFTLGYSFKPWRDAKPIADGPSILRYINETATEFGIDEHIRYSTEVLTADWSTDQQRWTLTVNRGGEVDTLTCNFVYVCGGYYNYEHTYSPQFPGIGDFAGRVVHPQFWPQGLDYEGQRIVVIGSGATAVTLVPSMASATTHVTMLQRSPTWISAVPSRDAKADWLRARLPEHIAHHLIRIKNVAFAIGFYQFCQRMPSRARALLLDQTTRILGDKSAVAEHFTPAYRPWDQRLCAAPGADLFKALKAGNAEVVTDTIETFIPEGIRLKSGRVLPADLVITATGLQLQTFGGITPTVDGEVVDFSREFVWKGAMVSGLPNFAFCIGYTNASWTLRADLSSRLVCKVLNWMRTNGYDAVVPTPKSKIQPRPLFGLTSGYVKRSVDAFPKQGDRTPWRAHQNYLLDTISTLHTGLAGTLTPSSRHAQKLRTAEQSGTK
ncbi:NAD(P)/FAD-dependent oxidoreductase [Mycobacteroides abscessus subsp. massiliense]|uniref:flavin-containing monooxygenase n=1 Tax=Mycobacteroides abscessus TaxID=36809 RepID=UPI00266C2052|nr:NAD(P)/FAD-dependent oxidoreductase [Mycobacteroides abscessus]MDO3301082.1 NAD(P)/FAD-dependent oxidoreductase [Mycobacteroides abscessus subsp. massiliense]